MASVLKIDGEIASVNGSQFRASNDNWKERGHLGSYALRMLSSYGLSHQSQHSDVTLLPVKVSKIEVDTFETVRCVDWTETLRHACRDVFGVEPGSWGRR